MHEKFQLKPERLTLENKIERAIVAHESTNKGGRYRCPSCKVRFSNSEKYLKHLDGHIEAANHE